MSNPQPTAAPITPEEIAALRDALAKATQGDLAPKLLAALDAAEVRAKVAEFDRMAFEKLSDTTMKAAEISSRAKDAAEAQAVKFAWDALAFAGVCVNSESGIYDDCANSSAESAAEYLAARGLLRKTGERTWQRVNRKEGGSE